MKIPSLQISPEIWANSKYYSNFFKYSIGPLSTNSVYKFFESFHAPPSLLMHPSPILVDIHLLFITKALLVPISGAIQSLWEKEYKQC